MSSTKHQCRFARIAAYLLFSALFLASVSTAKAELITYDIVNYPSLQAYLDGPGNVQVSGSLTIDYSGTPGPISLGAITGTYTITLPTTPTPTTYTETYSADNSGGSLYATATTLYVLPGNYLQIRDQNGDDNLTYTNSANTHTWVSNGTYFYIDPDGDYVFQSSFVKNGLQPGFQPAGMWDASHDMVVATVAVPEPSTFALLGIGAVSLLAYAWRKRRTA